MVEEPVIGSDYWVFDGTEPPWHCRLDYLGVGIFRLTPLNDDSKGVRGNGVEGFKEFLHVGREAAMQAYADRPPSREELVEAVLTADNAIRTGTRMLDDFHDIVRRLKLEGGK